jgi:hypothetical protein
MVILLPITALAGPMGPHRATVAVEVAQDAPWPPQCSAQERRMLQLEIKALQRLRQLARGDGDKLCAGIEAADRIDVAKLIDPKSLDALLSDHQRDLLRALGVDIAKIDVAQLMRLLGIDSPRLDLRVLQQQCRQTQGGIERFAREQLGELEQAIARCEDRV